MKIFGEDTRGKEVIITYETVQGEKIDDKGLRTPTEEHDVYAKFQIRDRTRRFNVNDRSLGFRWFFAFMLFTQFRVARSGSRPLLFLFDEPASNLHAAAQQKLIDLLSRNSSQRAYTGVLNTQPLHGRTQVARANVHCHQPSGRAGLISARCGVVG